MPISNDQTKEIEDALKGLSFPAEKSELIERAKTEGVTEGCIGYLASLEARSYESVEDVTDALNG